MMIAVPCPTTPAIDARQPTSASRAADASEQDPASTPDQSGATFADAMAGVGSRGENGQNERQAPDDGTVAKQEDAAPPPPSPFGRDRAARILALASSGDEAAGTPPRRYGTSLDPSGATPPASAETGRADEAPRRATRRASDPADVQALAAAAVQGGMPVPMPSTPAAVAQGETVPAPFDRLQPRAPGTASQGAALPAGPRLLADADPGSPTPPPLTAGALGIANVSAETALAVVPPATLGLVPAAPGAIRAPAATRSASVSAHASMGVGAVPARIAQAPGQSLSSRGSGASDRGPEDTPARADLPKAAEAADASGMANAGSGWTPASATRDGEPAGNASANPAATAAPAAADPQPQPVRSVSFDIDGPGSDPVRVRMRMRGDSVGLDLRADSENLRRLSTDDLRQSLERAGYAIDSIKLTASAPAATTPADSGTHAGDQQQQRHYQPQRQASGAGEPDASGAFGTNAGAGQGRAFAGQRDTGRRTQGDGAAPARADARGSSGPLRRDVIV